MAKIKTVSFKSVVDAFEKKERESRLTNYAKRAIAFMDGYSEKANEKGQMYVVSRELWSELQRYSGADKSDVKWIRYFGVPVVECNAMVTGEVGVLECRVKA